MDDDALMRRIQYETEGIDVGDVDPDPYRQFSRWFADAAAVIVEANAMTLATAGPEGPSARTVLLRSVDDGTFRFFTNRASRKGRDIEADPRVSMLFVWLPLHRQVRIDGIARLVDDAVSDAYFEARPVESRAGAIASPQSEVIADRGWLEGRVEEVLAGPLLRPPHWGGYAVTPTMFEFWQGRANRLHDRVRYRQAAGGWVRERLAP